jgi:hypothetical protein
VTLAFNSTSGLGRPEIGTLIVDGKVVATQTLEKTIPIMLPIDETFDIGAKSGTPIDDRDYPLPFTFTFTFTGKITKLNISVEPPVLTEADKKKLMEGMRAGQDAN